MRNINKIRTIGLLLILLNIICLFFLIKERGGKINSESNQTIISIIEHRAIEKITKNEGKIKEFEQKGLKEKKFEYTPDPAKRYYSESYPLNKGWGYRIYFDQKMVIDQSHIPAINNIIGFSNKEQAQQIANLVIKKIKKGIFPPTISIAELDSLKVIY